MLLFDAHTHTRYSHGTGTVEQNVLAAIEKGIPKLGISEHGPGHMFFPVKWPALIKLRKEIDRMNILYFDKIQVLMGLEVNLTGDGKTDMPQDTSIFDYTLLGFHKGTLPTDSISRGWMRAFLFGQGKGKGKENAMAYARAMDTLKNLLYITHPGAYIPVDITTLAIEAKKRDVGLEINESHRTLNAEHIKETIRVGAKLYVGSDAHKPKNIGVVDKSISLAKMAGAVSNIENWKEP